MEPDRGLNNACSHRGEAPSIQPERSEDDRDCVILLEAKGGESSSTSNLYFREYKVGFVVEHII